MIQELKESKERLENLTNAFNLCEPDFIEVIILEQLAEEKRYGALWRIAREGK